MEEEGRGGREDAEKENEEGKDADERQMKKREESEKEGR